VERRKACARRFARAAPQGAEGSDQRLPAFRFLFIFCSLGMIVMKAGVTNRPSLTKIMLGKCEWRIANGE
jgi:hypothetical protein